MGELVLVERPDPLGTPFECVDQFIGYPSQGSGHRIVRDDRGAETNPVEPLGAVQNRCVATFSHLGDDGGDGLRRLVAAGGGRGQHVGKITVEPTEVESLQHAGNASALSGPLPDPISAEFTGRGHLDVPSRSDVAASSGRDRAILAGMVSSTTRTSLAGDRGRKTGPRLPGSDASAPR